MGWVGLAAVLVPLPELGAGLGLVAEAAAGAEGAGVARAEEVVEDGVTAADWLRELGRAGQHLINHTPKGATARGSCPEGPCTARCSKNLNHLGQKGQLVAPAFARGQGARLTWTKSCSQAALRSPVSWPGPAQSGPPAHLQNEGDSSSDITPTCPAHGAETPCTEAKGQRGKVVATVGPGDRGMAAAQIAASWKLIALSPSPVFLHP